MTRTKLIEWIERLPADMAVAVVAASPNGDAASASAYQTDAELYGLSKALQQMSDRLSAFYQEQAKPH